MDKTTFTKRLVDLLNESDLVQRGCLNLRGSATGVILITVGDQDSDIHEIVVVS